MTKEIIKSILNKHTWVLLDETEHFARYRSTVRFVIGSTVEEFWLKHVPKGLDAAREAAAYNVANWNAIHEPSDKAYESTDEQWVAPYFGSRIATDERVAKSVFEIYKVKQYIIADACDPQTFLSGARGAYCVSVLHSYRCGALPERLRSVEADSYYKSYIRDADSDKAPRAMTASVILDLLYIERNFPTQELHADLTWKRLSIIKKLRQLEVIPTKAIVIKAFSLDPVKVTNYAKKVSTAQRIGYSLDEGALEILAAIADYDAADEIEDARLGDFLACAADYPLAMLALRYGYQRLITTLCGIWGASLLALEDKPHCVSFAIAAAKSTDMPPLGKVTILKLLHQYGFNMNAELVNDSPELNGLTPLDFVRALGDRESESFLVSLDAWTRADFVSVREISEIVDKVPKESIGRGAYNKTYRTSLPITINGRTGLWVIKCPIGTHPLNNNKRAIRKWDKVHVEPKDKAFLLTKGRWLAPDFGAVPASDKDTQGEVLRIFRETGELFEDGCGKGNCLTVAGETKCVDVDFLRKRRGSLCSDNDSLWPTEARQRDYLKSYSHSKPLTVATITCLEYLESCLPIGAIKVTYLTPEMIAKLMLIYSDIRVNSAILDILVRQNLLEVNRFINAYHFINAYQKENRLTKIILNRHDLYCLAYLISLDVAREIPDSRLYNFLKPLRVNDIGRVAYLAAEFGLLRFLQSWVAAEPTSIDMPGLNNVSPVMIAAHSTKVKSPEVRYQMLQFFIGHGHVVDLERQYHDPGTLYHGWTARNFVAEKRDFASFRLLCAASERAVARPVLSGAGAGFFSGSEVPGSTALLAATAAPALRVTGL